MALAATVRHFTAPRKLQFVQQIGEAFSASAKNVVIIGSKDKLAQESILGAVPAGAKSLINAMIDETSAGSSSTTQFFNGSNLVKYTVAALPGLGSRNHPPSRPFAITNFVSSVVDGAKGDVAVVVALDKAEHALAAACAVARCLPVYNKKTSDSAEKAAEGTGSTTLTLVHSELSSEHWTLAQAAAESIRVISDIVDAPPEEMNTVEFHQVVEEWVNTSPAAKGKVSITAIVGDELKAQGFGGIYGVGKQGSRSPRLVALTYQDDATKEAEYSAALVGKGIVYDTGGLSIKISGGMVGMKGDCGGAAGVFGAFRAAVESGQYKNIKLHLILCLAENCIGPDAMRNDDILYMFSGKTVEINNTDAEGRLVLADGVSYASRIFKPDLILDMATLTGAQGVTTGKLHCGVVASKAEAEAAVVRSGLRSGDAAFPMLYAPELLRAEFKSSVADMRNSVKDRANAQSSCAATFIEDHLDAKWKEEKPHASWIHCDIAYPAHRGDRATGYGVALVLDLLKNEAQAACKPSF